MGVGENPTGLYDLPFLLPDSHRRRRSEHEEVELLFENYFKQMHDLAHQINQLKSEIKNLEDVINIRLDS